MKMAEALYVRYENIFLLGLKYRKYEKIDEKLEQDVFMQQMQQVGYVKVKFKDPINFRPVYFLFISEHSNLASKSAELRNLLDSFRETCEIVLLMKNKLKQNIDSVLVPRKHLNITVFLQKYLTRELPAAPLCGRNRILERDEVLRLLNDDLDVRLSELPIIRAEDPQCMWINAKVGDVIETVMESDNSGETVHYRVVVASSVRRLRSDATERKKEEDGSDDEDESSGKEDESDDDAESDLDHLDEFRDDDESDDEEPKKLLKRKGKKKKDEDEDDLEISDVEDEEDWD
jgi:DNA-directed RNA polymerase subunit H (RpoH/RPB5)